MSNFEISTNPGERGNANLIYILYLVGIAAGITAVIGVIMAYMAKDNNAPDWLKTHYQNQISIFWKTLIYMVVAVVVSTILMIVLIGFILIWLLPILILVWYIIRVVQGMQLVSQEKPVANPGSWTL